MPGETARNGDCPVASLHAHCTANDIFLTDFPGIATEIRVSFCPDTGGAFRNNTVDDALFLSRSVEDDYVPPAQAFDSAGLEKNPVPGPKERKHAFATAEDRVFVFCIHSGHAFFYPLSAHVMLSVSLRT